ncbi:MFS general substrate transporter [Tothia fuscella]|uniref:MFS general substrate transporter n=1 Tax=Tothia fuscella TaxID=1048955 RepID=A0A9P4NUM8_9PEZI|nr:MFS general substrate transporter [Tothia fuscella]
MWKPLQKRADPPRGRNIRTHKQRETQITTLIDLNGFSKRVWAVAATGFFTNSYNLFATNVISPSLAYVYWNDATSNDRERNINVITLCGSVVGMILFGFLADLLGRRRLYGVELVLVTVASLGMAQCSEGFHSMDIVGWLSFWRLVLGVGIGAEYPLSAVISAEWTPTKSRARMMAAVFLMQPLGQFVAYLVGLCALIGISKNRELSPDEKRFDHAAPVVDAVWRCVVGVGAFPALIAIAARLSIPETPRYNLWKGKDKLAYDDATKVYGRLRDLYSGDIHSTVRERGAGQADAGNGHARSKEISNIGLAQLPSENTTSSPENGMVASNAEIVQQPANGVTSDSMESAGGSGQNVRRSKRDQITHNQFSRAELGQYFFTEGNWRLLAGTSLCWALWDIAYYGLALNNPRTISKIWLSHSLVTNGTAVPMWNSDPANPDASIYEALYTDATRSLITISIGSIVGSVLILGGINWVRRDRFLVWTFLALGVLFATMAGTIFGTYQNVAFPATIVLYTLAEILFNLGPNTLTFILPAELFPTRYRCFCHGIAAASGKIGSIIIHVILPHTSIYNVGASASPLARMLGIFAVLMAFGALFAWAWIPTVQYERSKPEKPDVEGQQSEKLSRNKRWTYPSIPLEVLTKGQQLREKEVDTISMRDHLAAIFRRRKP